MKLTEFASDILFASSVAIFLNLRLGVRLCPSVPPEVADLPALECFDVTSLMPPRSTISSRKRSAVLPPPPSPLVFDAVAPTDACSLVSSGPCCPSLPPDKLRSTGDADVLESRLVREKEGESVFPQDVCMCVSNKCGDCREHSLLSPFSHKVGEPNSCPVGQAGTLKLPSFLKMFALYIQEIR